MSARSARPPKASASARSRCRNSAPRASVSLRFADPGRRRGRAERPWCRRRATPSATTTIPPRRDGRAARLGRARAVRHHRRRALGPRGAGLSLVPLRAASSPSAPIIGTLHDIVLTHRLLRDHAARVQHDLDRGDPDHRRLFAERDRRGVRPHARADAPLQDDADRGAAQPVDQLHHVAHGDDGGDDGARRCWRWCCSAARRSRASRRSCSSAS